MDGPHCAFVPSAAAWSLRRRPTFGEACRQLPLTRTRMPLCIPIAANANAAPARRSVLAGGDRGSARRRPAAAAGQTRPCPRLNPAFEPKTTFFASAFPSTAPSCRKRESTMRAVHRLLRGRDAPVARRSALVGPRARRGLVPCELKFKQKFAVDARRRAVVAGPLAPPRRDPRAGRGRGAPGPGAAARSRRRRPLRRARSPPGGPRPPPAPGGTRRGAAWRRARQHGRGRGKGRRDAAGGARRGQQGPER